MKPDVFEVEPGVFLVLDDGTVTEARTDGTTVTIDGVRYSDLTIDSRKWNPAGTASQTQGRSSIKALMPGKIVRVLVSVGDTVAVGQGVLVIEAMKMQNEMKAARAGAITEVHARENDTVEAGTLLLVID